MAPDCASGRRIRLAQLCSAGLFGLLLIVAACVPAPADPPAVISYDTTPRPIPSETLRPTFTRIRSTRGARTAQTSTPRPPVPATVDPRENPPAGAVQPPAEQDQAANPSDPAADAGTSAPDGAAASDAPEPVDATPTPILTPVSPIAANPGSDDAPAVTPTEVVAAPSPSPTPPPDTATPTPRPTSTRVVTPTRTPTPSWYPGEVTEDQGLFVTSRTSGTKYYYAKDDTGWRRIHPENRVWFMTAADLLRAFPNRIFHSPTPTRTPTRAP